MAVRSRLCALPDTGIEADFRQPAYSDFGRQTCHYASRLALRHNDFCLYSGR